MKSAALPIRPYARLLTMLGDQLIKNERIALVELIKNAYDADATRVQVRFEEFNEDMSHSSQSHIVIQDDGTGMELETVRTQWMNPAAPQKHLEKLDGSGYTAEKKRAIQGEKGIGRFAVLKLGRIVRVITRTTTSPSETTLLYDFSRFDDDFVSENDQRKELFLDEMKIDCQHGPPKALSGNEHGTIIEISELKGTWNQQVIDQLGRDVSNLTDPVSRITRREVSDVFEIGIYCNGERQSVEAHSVETLKSLIEDKPVLGIQGMFRSRTNSFVVETGLGEKEVNVADAKVKGLWIWRRRFGRSARAVAPQDTFKCGDFKFQFYIFDFSRGIEGRYALTQSEKNVLKDHRIYLYRDDMRVYPYGDPDDDWLSIDVTRGTGRAGDFFSNDQIIGWIDITHRGNPKLRDKTNREGLIETGGAAADLIFLVQTFLSYVKQYPFARYQQKQRQRNTAYFVREGAVPKALADLKEDFKRLGMKSHVRKVSRVEAEYGRERDYLSRRAEMTEDLAGVGLSVEMASHDIMLLMGRAEEIGTRLARQARGAGDDEVVAQADMLVGILHQVVSSMSDVQSLFKSSRRRRKVLKIDPILDKICDIYSALLEKKDIHYQKVRLGDKPLVAHTTDGVIMQVLINLFDNAAYWLDTMDSTSREIRVTVDGERGELTFSDNGPGIETEDLGYVFEPFYSGKGEEGRGLGLYIARQLLERHGYQIEVAADKDRVLSGANFVVSFVEEDA